MGQSTDMKFEKDHGLQFSGYVKPISVPVSHQGRAPLRTKCGKGGCFPALASESLSCWNSTISLKDTLESECLFPNDGLLLAVVFSR